MSYNLPYLQSLFAKQARVKNVESCKVHLKKVHVQITCQRSRYENSEAVSYYVSINNLLFFSNIIPSVLKSHLWNLSVF